MRNAPDDPGASRDLSVNLCFLGRCELESPLSLPWQASFEAVGVWLLAHSGRNVNPPKRGTSTLRPVTSRLFDLGDRFRS